MPGKFADDERLCQRLCPAAEAMLYTHRNPGEDVSRAVSTSGRAYSELPNAFSYRKQLNAACSCRSPGQSWAEALRQGDDETLERGDIVVTEERARQLSQPRVDAKGRPVTLDPNAGRDGPAAQECEFKCERQRDGGRCSAAARRAADKSAPPPAEQKVEEDTSKRKVRAGRTVVLSGAVTTTPSWSM